MRKFIAAVGKHRVRSASRAARFTLERLETREVLAPMAPTGLVASGTSISTIALTWNASPDPTVTGYDVYSKTWINGAHSPKGSGGSPGHYVFSLIAANLHTNSDPVSGLKTGTNYSYVVTALSSTGQSPYSAPATAETWIAPSFPNGPNTYLLSIGALYSGPVKTTAGQTTQISLLVSGNPLTFSVLTGPSSVSIDPKSGVVTFTPVARDVGTVNVTFKASNPVGAVTQTIQFIVAAPDPTKANPTLSLYANSSTYNGSYQSVSARAVGTDGVTSVTGTYAVAYNGSTGYMHDVGTYPVLVTFTSYDPKYNNATLLTTFTITKASPVFNNLSSQSIAIGASTTTFSGIVSAGSAVPTGDSVVVTINGVSQTAAVDTYGNFSSAFATASLPLGNYTVSYVFSGDPNFTSTHSASTLTVIPTGPPRVTVNPSNVHTTEGDSAVFNAAATGSPVPSVQWQVSTDGGLTFTNVTSNASASTNTLVFVSYASQNGNKYRAVFTNSVGIAYTTVATLLVDTDTGGGN